MTRCGLPSIEANESAITGMSSVARTIAQAIRWVNESFLPAPLSVARRAASVSTASVRKLVAVGIERLSSMKRTSVAAGPRIVLASAPSGGAGALGAALPPPFTAVCAAARTSSLVMRSRGPLPLTAAMSMPRSAAIRAATGVALASLATAPLPPDAGGAAAAGALGAAPSPAAAGAAGASPPAGAAPPSPTSISPSTVPTVTVSSGWTWIAVRTPATGEGTSASTLSVEISTRPSSTSTRSPTCFSHSSTTPSVTDSPIAGISI